MLVVLHPVLLTTRTSPSKGLTDTGGTLERPAIYRHAQNHLFCENATVKIGLYNAIGIKGSTVWLLSIRENVRVMAGVATLRTSVIIRYQTNIIHYTPKLGQFELFIVLWISGASN